MALKIDEIRAAADRVATSFGMEVVDVEFLGNSKARTLRVYLEKTEAERARFIATAHAEGADPLPQGVPIESLSGITHEDCARFAQDFGTLLDVEDLVPGAEYTLEVSSPGLDRRLTAPRDYQRFVGSLVKLQTVRPIRGNRQWRGRLQQFGGDAITLNLAALRQKGKAKQAADEETVVIPLAEIEKANLLADL